MEFILETICPKNKWMGAYVKNLGEYADIGTDISFYNSNIETFFFLFFLTVLELSMFLKKLKISWPKIFRIEANN